VRVISTPIIIIIIIIISAGLLCYIRIRFSNVYRPKQIKHFSDELFESSDQSINQSIWRIFIAPLKIKFHRGASTRRHNHTGTILNDI